MAKVTLGQRLRYRFDNLMAKGVGAQIALLGLVSVVIICVVAGFVAAFGVWPADDDGTTHGFRFIAWKALMRTMDAGNMADDTGAWTYMAAMLVVTMGGIFVISALVGILNNGIEASIDRLRKGKSFVVEDGHTVILGFAPKIHTVLSELAEANANKPGACVVVLADRDKVEMDDEIHSRLEKKKLKVVTRSGSPQSLNDLEVVNLPQARSVIVLSPEANPDGDPLSPQEADTLVLKTLLAISKARGHEGHHFHVVAELQNEKTMSVARMVAGPKAALVLAPPLISRLLVQTGRQSGLSVVYSELLDFGGAEIYIQPEPRLDGKTFREVIDAYDDSAVIGVVDKEEKLLLPPPFDRKMIAGDQVIAISEDDDTVIPNGRPSAPPESALAPRGGPAPKHAERTLVLGASERLPLVLKELDAYVAAGSEAVVVGEDEDGSMAGNVTALADQLGRMKVEFRPGDVTDREVLDALGVPTFDHVMVLSETTGRDQEVADARTMITLLHLRDIDAKAGKRAQVTSEILDVQNRELAAVAEADDFVVSNRLISLMMSQVSENRELVEVFDELFRPEGFEIYLKPATLYVNPGADVDFYGIVEAAARRNEVAIGYRVNARAQDSAASYGVVVNPKKSSRIKLGAEDKVIVLAEDY
jgi:Trk K+ transport system NAD-binding subunit